MYSVLALSLAESSKGSVKDITALSIPLLFAGSSLAAMIEEAYRNVIEVEIKANIWKMRAASLGSVAAGLTVIMDISDIFEKGEKKAGVPGQRYFHSLNFPLMLHSLLAR